MKIIFSNYDSLNNPYYGGGGAVAIHAVAKRLAQDHHVIVVAGRFPGSKDLVLDNVLYKYIALTVKYPQIDQLIYQICLPFFMLTQKFDIWIESFTPPFSTSFLPLFTKKPVIGVTHLLAGKEMSKKYHIPFYILESLGLRQYKNIIVLSEFLKKQVLASGTNANISVIPNGLNEETIERRVYKNEKHILFLGRLDIFHKGLDVLLDAYKIAAGQIDYNLILAGSGLKRDEEWLKTRINKLGIGQRVKMMGKVGDTEKTELLDSSVFTIIPSRVEGFAIVALEAMAAKCPLIISNIQGLQWIPETCAVRFEKFDSREIAKNMIELSENAEKRELMGAAGKELVKQYTWDNVAKQYEYLISELV